LKDIALLVLVALIAYGLGARLLRWMRVECDEGAERIAFASALGLGALAYAVFALGLAGMLRLPAFIALLLIASALGWRDVFRLLESLRRFHRPRSLVSLVLGAALAVSLLLGLVGMRTPPALQEWDSLSYHLAVPKRYFQQARIFFIPYDHHSNFPFTMEMLYTLGLSLSSDYLAKGFHLLTGVLCVVAMIGFARRFLPELPRAGLVAGVLFASVPLVVWEAGTAYIDLGLTLFTLLAVYGVTAWWYEHRSRWLVISGIMAGLAAGVKMTGLGTLLILGLIVAFGGLGKQRLGPAMCSLGAFAIPALLVAAPWYIKTLLWTGNPVYPFFYGIFGGINWSQEQAEAYREAQQQFGCGHGLLAFMLLPFNLTFTPGKFFDVPLPRSHIGPAFLAFVPLLALRRPLARGLGILLAFAAGSTVVWFVLSQQSRYFIPVLAALSICAAVGALQVGMHSPQTSRLVGAAVAGVAVPLLILNVLLMQFAFPVAFGMETRERFLKSALPGYDVLQYANDMLPRHAKLALYGYPFGYYLDRDYMWADEGHHTLIPYRQYTSPGQLVQRWRELGVTHVLISRQFAGDILEGKGDMGRLIKPLIDGEFEDARLEPLYDARGVILYKLDISSDVGARPLLPTP